MGSNVITHFQTLYASADGYHFRTTLVTQNEASGSSQPMIFCHMQVGAADAAARNSKDKFSLAGRWIGHLLDL